MDDRREFNHCAAKTVYIRFQAHFRLNKIPLKFVINHVVDAQLIKYFQFGRCLFFINIIIFHSFEAGNCVSNFSFK